MAMWNPYYQFVNPYHFYQYHVPTQFDPVAFYESDEFRMYSFKIKHCPRQRSHDWTQCPFAHRGERAARRDPRRINYCGVPCPDFRDIGACIRGDACLFAHGVFEQWLHPERYRTRLCSAGLDCQRQVCFFAHSLNELRVEESAFFKCQCIHPPWPQTRAEAARRRERNTREEASSSYAVLPEEFEFNFNFDFDSDFDLDFDPSRDQILTPQVVQTYAPPPPLPSQVQLHAVQEFHPNVMNAFNGGSDFLASLSGVKSKKGKEKASSSYDWFENDPDAPDLSWIEDVMEE